MICKIDVTKAIMSQQKYIVLMYYLLAAGLFKMILPFFINPLLKLIKMSIINMTGKMLLITWNSTVRDVLCLKQFTITVNTRSISMQAMTNTYQRMSLVDTGKNSFTLLNFSLIPIFYEYLSLSGLNLQIPQTVTLRSIVFFYFLENFIIYYLKTLL